MHVAWHSLGQILLIGLLVGAGCVAVFGAGVRELSQATTAREAGRSDPVAYSVAGLCFALCAAVVGYGIYLLVAPRFH